MNTPEKCCDICNSIRRVFTFCVLSSIAATVMLTDCSDLYRSKAITRQSVSIHRQTDDISPLHVCQLRDFLLLFAMLNSKQLQCQEHAQANKLDKAVSGSTLVLSAAVSYVIVIYGTTIRVVALSVPAKWQSLSTTSTQILYPFSMSGGEYLYPCSAAHEWRRWLG